jgi:hypothetical protein
MDGLINSKSNKMKRPNQYSKPLEGVRTESYHPADYANNQYAKDLNTYIDYLEMQQRKMYSEEDMEVAFMAGGNVCIEDDDYVNLYLKHMKEWIEQFKKDKKSKHNKDLLLQLKQPMK